MKITSCQTIPHSYADIASHDFPFENNSQRGVFQEKIFEDGDLS